MDWANHYLRKAGCSASLSDLKDIADGQLLPQIIQAVGVCVCVCVCVSVLCVSV